MKRLKKLLRVRERRFIILTFPAVKTFSRGMAHLLLMCLMYLTHAVAGPLQQVLIFIQKDLASSEDAR